METVNLYIDVTETAGKIPGEVAGIMTDPPRPDDYNQYLLAIGGGDEEEVALQSAGFNASWLPVLEPAFMNLGWGGDTWYRFNTWPAEGQYNWRPLDNWVESHLKWEASISLVFSLVPRWLWSEDAPEESGAAWKFFPYLKRGHVLPPASYEKYEELIYQTVRHLNIEKKYGVKFTVWNEPNVKFWQGTQEQLLELSEHTARAIKRADPHTMVGGPATANLAPGWIEAFVRHFAENDLPLDFISWHYYLYYAERQKNVMNFREQIDLVKGIIEKYPPIGNPKLFITEWAYDWKPAEVTAPTFNAAFVAQSLLEMMEGGLDGATYCGPMGSINTPDPAAHAFMIFKRLERNRIAARLQKEETSVGVIASSGDGRIALMVWDFPTDGKPGKQKSKSIFIKLENLGPGGYQYNRYLVDSEHRGAEAAKVEHQKISSDGSINLDFELKPYAITLIELNGMGAG